MEEKPQVPNIRSEIKEICHNSEHSSDISYLLDCATQLSERLFYIQEQEASSNTTLTDAKYGMNQVKESIKSDEYTMALFLNSEDGGSLAMNKAEKMAYLKSKPLRDELEMAQLAYNEADKDYKDTKGFGTAVKEYLMTIRQKVKNLQIEAGVYPHRQGEGQ